MNTRFSILTLGWMLTLLWASGAWAQGQLVFDSTEHDFGVLDGSEQVVTTFTFTNTGDRALRLTTVRPSCGCTTPYFTEGEVLPGEKGEVQVGFDPQGRRGPFRQSIYLAAEVGADDQVIETLVVFGEVLPGEVAAGTMQGSTRFDAEVFDFGEVPAGQALQHRFAAQHTGSRPLHITAVYSFPGGAQITYPQLPVMRGVVVGIEVHLPEELVAGDFDVVIALETDDPQEPIKALRLVGTAR